MNSQRRILALDGGGIKGLFAASFLATVEDSIKDRIVNYFDLIVGYLNRRHYCSRSRTRNVSQRNISVLQRVWTDYL